MSAHIARLTTIKSGKSGEASELFAVVLSLTNGFVGVIFNMSEGSLDKQEAEDALDFCQKIAARNNKRGATEFFWTSPMPPNAREIERRLVDDPKALKAWCRGKLHVRICDPMRAAPSQVRH